MAAKCKKCDPHEICEECPEWIFTLADLIMCMMGLFVLLWVLKPTGNPNTAAEAAEMRKQEHRQTEVLDAIKKEFGGYVPDPQSGDPVDQATEPKPMRLVGPGEKGTQNDPKDSAEGTDPQVQSIRPGNPSPVGTRVDFARGEASLGDDDKRRLDDIAKQIVGTRFVAIVKGHAAKDDFDDRSATQAFMDVSLRRAQAAADYLIARGVSPDVLRVQGCSTFEPVRERAYSAESVKINRRVEVFVTDVVVADLADPERVTAAPLN